MFSLYASNRRSTYHSNIGFAYNGNHSQRDNNEATGRLSK